MAPALASRAVADLVASTHYDQSARSVAARGRSRLALVFGPGFLAVALQLVREQISQASAIHERAAALLQPATAQQPDSATTLRPADRTALGDGRVWPVATAAITRGAILDRNGVVLAATQGSRRVYPNPNLGQIVGFQSRLYGATGIEASFNE